MAEKRNNSGGPAFPVTLEGGQNNGENCFFEEGMTLRDYFAGKVIAQSFTSHLTPDELAEQAYGIADAMLAQRSK